MLIGRVPTASAATLVHAPLVNTVAREHLPLGSAAAEQPPRARAYHAPPPLIELTLTRRRTGSGVLEGARKGNTDTSCLSQRGSLFLRQWSALLIVGGCPS